MSMVLRFVCAGCGPSVIESIRIDETVAAWGK